mgnify:FL=1
MTDNPSSVANANVVSGRGLLAILAMVGSAACWGFSTVMSRDLLNTVPPLQLLVIQLVASVVALAGLALPHMPRHFRSPRLWRASTIGILEPGLTYSVGLVGLSLTTAGSASVIGATEPIMIVVIAWLFLRQQPSLRLGICIVIAVVGLLLVSGETLLGTGQGSAAGDGLIVLATFSAATYVVLSARLAGHFPAATLALAQQLAGLVFVLAVAGAVLAAEIEPLVLGGLSLSTLAYAALSGVVQYAIAFWLYLIGLRYLTPGAAGLWLTLVPVFGIFGAFVWLNEIPTAVMITGAVLIIGAVLVGRDEN